VGLFQTPSKPLSRRRHSQLNIYALVFAMLG
jgi:hypothetical protein